jgi:hypothetical protein
MKKSLIALAVAAALPVATQAADLKFSGSVTVKMTQDAAVDTDASLKVNVEELLSNGMTAKAEFEALDASDSNQGIASLSGDFGTLTAGSIDSDAAFQMGDVADVVVNTQDVDEDDTNVNGMHLAVDVSGIKLQVQRNGATDASGTPVGAKVKSTQVGLIYDLNGLLIGTSYASAKADNSASVVKTGIPGATSAFGLSYTFGDLTVNAGKQEDLETLAKATYKISMDAFTLEATAKKGGHEVIATYTMDGIIVSATAENGVDTKVEATYTNGDLQVSADSTNKISAAMDMGNADLTLERENKVTSLTYKVSF